VTKHEDESLQRGVPVYIEELVRDLSDPTLSIADGEWHPANDAARKLWACVEAMRDIEDILDSREEADTRRLKRLLTPLDSLLAAVVGLGNYLASSDDMKKQIATDIRKGLGKATADLKRAEAFTTPADLKFIRDKLSAHVDKKIQSWDAQEALSHLKPAQVRDAIQACLVALVTLLSVNVYAWTASDCPDGFVKIMTAEPTLITLKMVDGKPVASHLGVEIARSPRQWVNSYCRKLNDLAAEALCPN
jgi:hypothetical protein